MFPSDLEKYNGGAAEIASRVTLLADQARAGNKTAFEQLVVLFHRDIFRMVYYRTRNRPDAEDITQEVFMSAFSNLTSLKDAELNQFFREDMP
ncbi:MAG: sigma factor [Pseudomonadota bacterium]